MNHRAREKLVAKVPLSRTGAPSDIAAAAAFLCSAEAAYITGGCSTLTAASASGRRFDDHRPTSAHHIMPVRSAAWRGCLVVQGL
ncbi:SDR family oxidoreductase [Hoyosella subflava]|uniref:SDR family oxidoreductase n=1 Tax=Hoyosella subflava TaxID=639313 RepID=UPI001ED91E67|nr:SDR family oxidoreductase [Hoyosella subflava]